MVILTEEEVKRRAAQKKENDNRKSITVQKMQSIGVGRFKIKLAETHDRFSTLTISGIDYIVTRNLGRGRYIIRKGGERACN